MVQNYLCYTRDFTVQSLAEALRNFWSTRMTRKKVEILTEGILVPEKNLVVNKTKVLTGSCFCFRFVGIRNIRLAASIGGTPAA